MASFISATVTMAAAYHSVPGGAAARACQAGAATVVKLRPEKDRRPEELAPHADAVEDGLAAPERAAADAAHHALPGVARFAIRRWSPAKGRAKETGPGGDSLSPFRRYDRRT